MKITFVLPHAGLSGGIRVVAIYAQRLQQRGHDVTLVSTPWLPPGRRGRAWGRLRKLLFRLHPWPDGPLDPSHLDGMSVRHIRVDECRPVTDADVPDGDVVVATWWETAQWVAALSPRKGAKAHFLQGYEAYSPEIEEQVRAVWRLPLQKIVVARWLADIAREEFGDSQALVVHNSVDLQQFHSPPRSKQARPAVGLTYSSNPCKGCDICLAAVQKARRKVPHLRLVAFGIDELPREHVVEAVEYFCMPPQEKLKDIYASCDAWLFGSRREGFGLPILEAMACRTPVIATPAGAAPELVARGGGVLVRPDDPADMAEAICGIINLPDSQWQLMSEAAHATAVGYTWEDATDGFEQALHKVVSAACGLAHAQVQVA